MSDEARPPGPLPTEMPKSNPWPAWRVILADFVIVVLGVGVALAAQQAAERWREDRQYSEARAAIRDELEQNIALIRRRGEFADCTSRRMDEIGALLDRAEHHQPFTAPSWIGGSQSLRVRFSSEPEVGKSGVFSTQEQRTYSRTYSFLRSFDAEQDRERLAWARLQMLEGRDSLPPEMIYGLRTALADARFEHGRIELLRAGTFATGNQMGLGSDKAAAAGVVYSQEHEYPHCLPMTTPKAEGERLSRIVYETR